jgi:sec-independent protein translocase protein TatC
MTAEPTSQELAEQQHVEQHENDLDDARMSVIAHLVELRKRLIYSIIAIFIAVVACWTWVDQIFYLLMQPLRLAAPEGNLDAVMIHHKDLGEPFFAMLKIAVVAGIFVSSPVSLYNMWKFIAPGLYKTEKRVALPFVIMGTAFFFAGAAFCFYGVLPFGYSYLIQFGLDVSSNPELMLNEYLSTTTKMLLVFGAVFELPVVTAFLAALGAIDHNTLLKHWRGAIVGAFIIGAILTPPDPITQTLLSVPLCLLYGLSIGLAFFFSRGHERRQAKIMKELDELG